MTTNNQQPSNNNKGVGFLVLSGIIIGTMIGSGVYNMPKMIFYGSGGLAVSVAWIILLIGVISIGLMFNYLVERFPKTQGSLYSYAQFAFGDFTGLTVGWGYMLAVVLGDTSLLILLSNGVGAFVPALAQTSAHPFPIASFWLITILLWVYILTYIFVGVGKIAKFNFVFTIIKILPLFLFIIVGFVFYFNVPNFFHLIGNNANVLDVHGVHPNFIQQIQNTALVMMWAFLGLEGAVVLRSRAKSSHDVRKATVLSIIAVTIVYILITYAPTGMYSQIELQQLSSPATIGIMSNWLGMFGKEIMTIGVIVSVTGTIIAWTMMSIEMIYQIAKTGLFPPILTKQTKNGSPYMAAIFFAILTQLSIFTAFFYGKGFIFMVSISTEIILIPYLTASFFAFKTAIKKDLSINNKGHIVRIIITLIAVLFNFWVVTTSLEFLLLAFVLYIPASILYWIYMKRTKEKSTKNLISSIVVLLIGLIVLAVKIFY